MEYLFKKEKKSIRTKKDEIQENFKRERREGDKKMSRREGTMRLVSRYKSKEQKWRMMCPGTHRRCHCSRKPVSVSGGITGFGEIRTNTSVVRGRQTRALNREEIHPWTTRKQITSDRPGVQRTRTVGFYYFPFHPWNEITILQPSSLSRNA